MFYAYISKCENTFVNVPKLYNYLCCRRCRSGYCGRKEIKMRNLKDAKVGETVKVVKLHGDGAVRRRMMDMGLTKGTEVYLRKIAPLGDPIEVTLRGYELSIRKADAEMVEIE